jgi:DNA-binding NarL/FixJ family response regulator
MSQTHEIHTVAPGATLELIEAERQRIAVLIGATVIDSLNLLLSQAAIYEQTFAANAQARLAVSVLSSLARQTLQQARDLEAGLHPLILEQVGLEAALEVLTAQTMRTSGVHATLNLDRRHERLPKPLELAIFRATQDALHLAIHLAKASRLVLRLTHRHDSVHLALMTDGQARGIGPEALRSAGERVRRLGGALKLREEVGRVTLWLEVPLAMPALLTERELDVLVRLVQGWSNKQIAAALNISPRTVKFHLDNLYSKLGVGTRAGAVAYAMQHKLV